MKLFNNLKKKLEQKTVEYAQKDIDELSRILNRPKEGEIVKLENIKIPYYFKSPNEKKVEKRKEYFETHGYFRTPIVLNNKNFIVDGLITYLLALELRYDYITILRKW